jgi:hypothetical protein
VRACAACCFRPCRALRYIHPGDPDVPRGSTLNRLDTSVRIVLRTSFQAALPEALAAALDSRFTSAMSHQDDFTVYVRTPSTS